MKSAEKMRLITQHVERSSQEQARGGRRITTAIEKHLHDGQPAQHDPPHPGARGEQVQNAASRIEDSARSQESSLRQLNAVVERMRRVV